MTSPEQRLLSRRRQILDDETEEARRIHAQDHQGGWADGNNWVKNFVDRLAGLVRKIGGKD